MFLTPVYVCDIVSHISTHSLISLSHCTYPFVSSPVTRSSSSLTCFTSPSISFFNVASSRALHLTRRFFWHCHCCSHACFLFLLCRLCRTPQEKGAAIPLSESQSHLISLTAWEAKKKNAAATLPWVLSAKNGKESKTHRRPLATRRAHLKEKRVRYG